MKFAIILTFGWSVGCVSRVQVGPADPLRSLIGKRMVLRTEAVAVPVYNAHGKTGSFKAVPIFPGSDPRFYLKNGTSCKLVAFDKLPESQGAFIITITEIEIAGNPLRVEFEMHPSYDVPGRNQSEKVYHELRNKKDPVWVLMD